MVRCLTIEQHKLSSKRRKVNDVEDVEITINVSFIDQNLYIPPSLPILFMYGTKDGTCPRTYVNRMPSLIPNIAIIPLEEIAHWVLLEAPTRIVDEVLGFLDQLAGARAGPPIML
jgi:pimeloyl-ACP methyl ester carboxylesterase